MSKPTFAVFDVDGTLHDGALGSQFVMTLSRHEYTKNPIHELYNDWLSASDKTAFFMQYFYPEFETLKPISEDAMRRIGSELARETLSRIRPQLQQRIDWHRAQGHVLLIISTSPSVVIEPLVNLLGFTGCSAPLTHFDKRGMYTGPSHRTPEEKDKSFQLKQLISKYNLSTTGSWAYGDTTDDLPMLEYATHPVAVTPSPDLRSIAIERDWEIID